MFKSSRISHISVALLSILLSTAVFQTVGTVSDAHADSVVENCQNNTDTTKFVSSEVAQNKVDEALPTLTAQQIEQIQQNSDAYTETTTTDDKTTVTIDEDALDQQILHVIEPHTQIIPSPFISFAKKVGTTKIVFTGKASKGNFKIYLSSKMLNRGKSAGYSVLAQIALAPLALIPAPAGNVIRYACKKALTKVLMAANGPFKYGRIFTFKNKSYSSWSYQ